MFVLAHISDPHLGPMPRPRFADLLGKRITGYLNWQLRRAPHHLPGTIDAVVNDLLAAHPDHVVVTGDLVNLALPDEFAMARKFLARLGPPEKVSVIPGNHDFYVRGAEEGYLGAWRDFLSADEVGKFSFPFLRRRGPVAIIGTSTAVATPLFFATGRLSGEQLAQLESLLEKLRREKCFRVVLIHHPPVGDRPWLRRLEDAEAFRAVIARRGAELVLAGHDHIAARHEIPGPDGPVPVLQVPSASAPFGDKHCDAGYNLYRIDGAPGAWSCEMETRGIQANGSVASLGTVQLSPRRVTTASVSRA
jgi:3',5'-cyclic AMP phosphodiesterase CpdA